MNNLVKSPVEAIPETLERLRALSQVSTQEGWRYCDEDLPVAEALDRDCWHTWTLSEVNERDHHPWIKGRTVRWFSRIIRVPHDLQGYPLEGLCLRLALLWWAEEAQVYVNGNLVQEGDLFDCAPRLLLSSQVKPGEEFAIALRFISPIHDNGALMKSVCQYESLDGLPEPSFIANEFAVLHSYLATFQPEKLEILAQSLSQLDWGALSTCSPSDTHSSTHPFAADLSHLRQTLLSLAEPLKQRKIQLLGHAHLDMAWLWTVEETWKAAERTFQSVLKLQKDFPALTFAHTTPALYEWMEHNRPNLFTQIQAQVAAGEWEIVAGFWIEPELNLISGESIVRQVLYGQRYVQEKFGKSCAIAWVPDTFGFTWQLPQILKQGGVEYFVTQKLRWNDTTKFPYEIFRWQAPDGTQILSLMSAPIGEFIDPVKMTNFAWEWEQKTGIQTTLWLPGVGDHGGGPTRDMLEVAHRWQQSPFFPELEFGTALEYLEKIENREQKLGSGEDKEGEDKRAFALSTNGSHSALPVWNSELYLEYHRGCYTTHADQKKANRQSEILLYQAELWASLATIAVGVPYPKAEIETAWKKTLFNQFHDILPGSSITPVFVEANQTWQEVEQICSTIRDRAIQALVAQIRLPEPPVSGAQAFVVLNALNWERSQGVTLSVKSNDAHSWRIYDLEGNKLDTHCEWDDPIQKSQCFISFLAVNIPSVGYRCFWLAPDEAEFGQPESNCTIEDEADSIQLENEFLRVQLNETGELSSLFDKVNQREVLRAPGNQLQAFQDSGQYWDAWNIDPNYANHPLATPEPISTCKRDRKPFETSITVQRKIGQSIFEQTYTLQHGSPILEILTSVDWQERHVLLKAAFPLNLETEVATYEIPCGAIQRPTRPQTEAEKAQWEVPALHWADLSDGMYGVSLLNNCKYGYDAQPNQLRLTLLRGSEWPDPEADKGQHTFTYAIYPHTGDWKQAHTVRRGYELNQPMQTCLIAVSPSEVSTEGLAQTRTLPPVGSFLNLGSDHLILMAFKQAEATANEWVLRCYECHGAPTQMTLKSDLNLKPKSLLDGLERSLDLQKNQDESIPIQPWQIATFKISAT